MYYSLPSFLLKNMAYYYSNELLSAILLLYILKLKRNISNICSDDSVVNDYRFVDCGGWPLVSRLFFLFAYDVFDFLVNGLFYFLVEFAAFSNELPLRYVYG